ncbi:bifunctional diguanylate cyclase/phosphohydrolase [Natronospora cellulosivora (SeqCode)]
MLIETTSGKNLIEVGYEAANILTKNYNDNLVYKKMCEYIFNEISDMIDLIRLYIIDEQIEGLKEALIYHKFGWSVGFDSIALYQLPKDIIEKNKIIRAKYDDFNLLKIPLKVEDELLGLIEFSTCGYLEDDIIIEIKQMANIISYSLSNILLKMDTKREKESTEISIKVNNKLQATDSLEDLYDTFLNLSVKYFSFDRVSIFIYDENHKIKFIKGITEKGEEFIFDELPEIPDLSADYIPLDLASGYWYPLKTHTGILGVVLFDNIYTLHKISDSLLDTLRIVSSQFASTIDNIRMYSNLQRSAYYDALTGLYNRNYLEENLLEYEKEEYLPLSIIMGDLNGLKLTNDVFGHNMGDSLLKTTANILRGSSLKEDIVIRWGGDEFLILLPGKNESDAYDMCQTIKHNCSIVDDDRLQLSISLGCATRKSKEEKLMPVMIEAEDRMYRHKLLETKSYRSSLITSLRETLEEKCHETAGYAARMVNLAIRVGRKMGLNGSELDDLRLLAMLHDMGKVAVKDEILNKAGTLSDKEWEEIKKHPEVGYRIAHASHELSQISNYILNHHERWDGKGYPLGNKEKEIPLLSRIISVVDAYDVMTHKRPYKTAITHEEAIEELNRCAGSQFDPDIIKIFNSLNIKENM